jgi:hypothetical protein
MIRATLLLCDHAQVADGKLFISGGGWSITGPDPGPMGLAIKMFLPLDQQETSHRISLKLFYRDGSPVVLEEAGDQLQIEGQFSIGKVRGDAALVDEIDVPFATVLAPQPLPAGKQYEWRLFFDGETQDDWYLRFATRPALDVPPSSEGAEVEPSEAD